MRLFACLSLASLAVALKPVPLLAYSTHELSSLGSLNTNNQREALSTLFASTDVCDFQAVIVATQQDLHASHIRSTHSALLDRIKSSASHCHLPYLSHAESPLEHSQALAARCNSKLVHITVDEDSELALDPSEKHVVHLRFPSTHEYNADMVARQLAKLEATFPSSLVLLTGVSGHAKRQFEDDSFGSIPAPTPTPSKPLSPAGYRVLTPTLIYSFGIVFGFVIPLVYIAITALGSIKSPVGGSSFKAPSSEKKNQ
ncbi:SubName: Full=Uncharacterized protein {ECO:0000313/EMBL:CCA66999.1} [Serendipita indica DSM 11827]|uniref:Protein BIG1 n=1 Tax=Serendipita indica (strain DSM 11827) TaxID=1109443 RepID=G4T6P3_SERID|nr:SubName: Full=Uncharacterized protein {ECO:0000313/EMBL:CCA66999.1} [Serendipita indica DSM 11827]CCA66999.1 hypothetical protein PIIN_00836 [Serendipita indica DSM 11827]